MSFDANFIFNSNKDQIYNKEIIKNSNKSSIVRFKEHMARENFKKSLNSVIYSPLPENLFEALEQERKFLDDEIAIKQAIYYNELENERKEKELNDLIKEHQILMEVENVNEKLDDIKKVYLQESVYLIRKFKDTSCREILPDINTMKVTFEYLNEMSKLQQDSNFKYTKLYLKSIKHDVKNIELKERKDYYEYKKFHEQYRNFTKDILNKLDKYKDKFNVNVKKTCEMLRKFDSRYRKNELDKIKKLKRTMKSPENDKANL